MTLLKGGRLNLRLLSYEGPGDLVSTVTSKAIVRITPLGDLQPQSALTKSPEPLSTLERPSYVILLEAGSGSQLSAGGVLWFRGSAPGRPSQCDINAQN